MKWFTVIYRSGAKVQFQATDIKVKWNTMTGEVTQLSWPGAKAGQQPVLAGIQQIAAIWEGKV